MVKFYQSPYDRTETPFDTGAVGNGNPGFYNRTPRGKYKVYDRVVDQVFSVPETEAEALMVCAPGVEPVESIEEGEARRVAMMAQLADLLTDDELIVIDAVVFSRLTLEEAGNILARMTRNKNKAFVKSQVSKIRDAALDKLRAAYDEGTFDGTLNLE